MCAPNVGSARLFDAWSAREGSVRYHQQIVGVAGHSSGGETVLALAGSIFDGKHLQEFCNAHSSDLTCQPRQAILASLAKLEEVKKTNPVVQEAASR